MSQEDSDEFFYRDSIIIDAVPPPPPDEGSGEENVDDLLNDLENEGGFSGEENNNFSGEGNMSGEEQNNFSGEEQNMSGEGNMSGGDEQVEKRDPQLTEREEELISEINKLRTDPNSYAQLMIRRRKHFYLASELDEGQTQADTNIKEGKQAVLECIEVLEKAEAVPALEFKDGVHLASQDIREVIGDQNSTDPTSAEEVNEALYRYGSYSGRAVQLVGFGYNNPKEVLCHLLISDGEKERRSRQILLDPDFKFCGLAMGDHGMVVFHFITEEWNEN